MKMYIVDAPAKLDIEEKLNELNIKHTFTKEGVPKYTFGLLTDAAESDIIAALPDRFKTASIKKVTKEVAFDKWARMREMYDDENTRTCILELIKNKFKEKLKGFSFFYITQRLVQLLF